MSERGYVVPTPIQARAIPLALSGRDLLGAAQTGTGKTTGFTLAMLQLLAAKADAGASPAPRPAVSAGFSAPRPIRALVIAPTRELAAQVQERVRSCGRFLQLRSAVVFGGVGFDPQAAELRRGMDIVVATPGRLLDHVHQKTIDLGCVQILVLDEADRTLAMGFLPDVRRVLSLLPAKRQNLLFSATLPDEIRQLAGSFMRDPATVVVARRNAPIELVSQVVHPVEAGRKRELLAHLIRTRDWGRVLVFIRTKQGANRLAEQLGQEGIEAGAIHGNKAENARTRALRRFKAGELRVLVATDVAARGLDIVSLPHVVNYDLPSVPGDYVHRIGRDGAAGEAVSLMSAEDRPLLAAIERLIGRRIEQRAVPGFGPGYRLSAGRHGDPSRPRPRLNGNGARARNQPPGRSSVPGRAPGAYRAKAG
ncbi:MAG TPA: DEAD/DEAH box helicase [Burkholderiales bacterium]|nr:DEAD/DEAH box helicase [Burkholderiales bacterium]